ncbi:hypothetical protein HMPREF9069_00677 [Atopobium sp. oral taxon 810 str. F0209]|nr:hypothetical protein HMPREF9069_00677 [Atopobium sp. oral taxon 810 str. F0209]
MFIEPPAGKRAFLEPVVFPLMQTVQNRTKCARKALIKIAARVLFEPDVG